jgi:neutral ceramidase
MKSNSTLSNKHFQRTGKKGHLLSGLFMFCAIILFSAMAFGQENTKANQLMDIGVATVDITPQGPIRLTGYAAREKSEATRVIHRLTAKALAFGNDNQAPSILITVDLVGIPGQITLKLAEKLSKKVGINAAQLAICSSHTHGGPEVGILNILQARGNNFSDSLLALDQLIHISQYLHELEQKLEQVALAALENRKPALVAWGQGQANFAKNRRTNGGPVDPALPILSVTEPDGKLRAVLVNYACHGTTLEGSVNEIHGDWIGEAQKLIEANHPGAVAMIAIGCAGDANPQPRGKMEHMRLHGQEIANNVDKLLAAPLQPLTSPPVGRIKWVKLPFAHVPSVPELISQTSDKSVKGYYARRALERIARGQEIPKELDYRIQTWTFGDEMAMVNLAGEVTVDYSIRLKNELGAEKLWVNAYTNDVPCYIASRRVIMEGGYEAESSMWWYDKPSRFVEDIEDMIVSAVHEILPASFKEPRPATNSPKVVMPGTDNMLRLEAATARAIGPEIKYMPEWKAFGWFTEADKVEWDVNVKEKGKYDVYLEWSVSDAEAGKPFVLEAAKKKLNGKIGKTGSWFTYRNEKIGSIQLQSGNQKIVFKPVSDSPKGALLDLRSISLKKSNGKREEVF